jgi:hypothetical protein
LDNCRVHSLKATEQFITENHIEHGLHPSYSPDPAASDFWLFDHVKTSLVGRTFDEPEQLLEAITEFLNEIQLLEVVPGFPPLGSEGTMGFRKQRRLLS